MRSCGILDTSARPQLLIEFIIICEISIMSTCFAIMIQKECAFEILNVNPEDVYVEMGYGGALLDEQVVLKLVHGLRENYYKV